MKKVHRDRKSMKDVCDRIRRDLKTSITNKLNIVNIEWTNNQVLRIQSKMNIHVSQF